MGRLSRYLFRLFCLEALALFAVAAALLFLLQCLLLSDLVADRGQSLPTLVGQAALGMPPLGIVFLHVCVGIGLGRALRAMGGSNELSVIHSTALLPALLRSILVYALAGAGLALLLAHVVNPLSSSTSSRWTAAIAADIVSRSMVPNRVAEVADGVSIIIEARGADGEITGFFAHDARGPTQRSYFASSAILTRDEQGYILRLNDGAMQQLTADRRFSEISFSRYDLALDALTGSADASGGLGQVTSLALLGRLGEPAIARLLVDRSLEGLRVLAICAFVAALALFPSGARRGPSLPIELVVLGAAFLERGASAYLALPGLPAGLSGPLLMLAGGLVALAIRLRPASLRVAA